MGIVALYSKFPYILLFTYIITTPTNTSHLSKQRLISYRVCYTLYRATKRIQQWTHGLPLNCSHFSSINLLSKCSLVIHCYDHAHDWCTVVTCLEFDQILMHSWMTTWRLMMYLEPIQSHTWYCMYSILQLCNSTTPVLATKCDHCSMTIWGFPSEPTKIRLSYQSFYENRLRIPFPKTMVCEDGFCRFV